MRTPWCFGNCSNLDSYSNSRKDIRMNHSDRRKSNPKHGSNHDFDFFVFACDFSPSSSVFLFEPPAIRLLFLVPSLSFPCPFNGASFLVSLLLPLVFASLFFAFVLALAFSPFLKGSSFSVFSDFVALSSDGDEPSESSAFLSSAFFLSLDFGSGVPFFGSFLDPGSFS